MVPQPSRFKPNGYLTHGVSATVSRLTHIYGVLSICCDILWEAEKRNGEDYEFDYMYVCTFRV